MKKKVSVITAVVFTLIISAISGIFVWWIDNQFNRPEIDWVSRPYYKIDDVAIGNIYLWNAGHKTDRKVTITLAANIKKENIKIVDLISDYKIQHNDNKTSIIINELRPDESADITFKDDGSKDDVEITSFFSENSNIVQLPFGTKPEWWHLSLWTEGAVILAAAVIGIGLGYVLGKKTVGK